MAYCGNCGRPISDEALMCPLCGRPGPAAMPRTVTGELAGWGTRVGATLLDVLVLLVPAMLLLFAFIMPRIQEISDEAQRNPGQAPGIPEELFWPLLMLRVVLALYKPLFEGATGQTLGKKWVGIRVVQEDGSPIGYPRAFFRWLVFSLFGLVPILDLVNILWPLWDPRKQTLHDKAAKTLVVRV